MPTNPTLPTLALIEKYEITSRATLPVRMKGNFAFSKAHELCCEWNRWHATADMAYPTKVDSEAVPLEFA